MTHVSTTPASKSSGIAIAVVAIVAASNSSHAPRRLAIVHAASGRNTANSSGSACGVSTSSSVIGVMSRRNARSAVIVPSASTCVTREKSVAAVTNAIAARPAACLQRVSAAAPRATQPAMKPATQASACSASTVPLRPSTKKKSCTVAGRDSPG